MEHHIKESLNQVELEGRPSELLDDSMKLEHVHQDASKDEMQSISGNVLQEDDLEAEFHLKTWLAVLALFFLNFVQVFALLGPPQILEVVAVSLGGQTRQTWIPNATTLVQASFGPILSSISDTFQARKILLVITTILPCIGAAIIPGANSIERVIAGQVLIGFGLSSVPLAYAVPSEILPKKWRPMVQGYLNIAAGIGAISAPIIGGALVKRDPVRGWRNFWWIEFALWGTAAILILLAYKPPKRKSSLDSLSVMERLRRLDILGFVLLLAGLILFLAGLNLGGNLYSWKSGTTLGTLCAGLVVLAVFAVWEWKGTTTGMLNHEMFRGGKNYGRTFALAVSLVFVEGILLFAYLVFYPVLTAAVFESDPLLQALRGESFWFASCSSTLIYAYWSQRYRTIKWPLFAGFAFFTAGMIGLSTIQPGDSTSACAFAALAGLGMGSPLVVTVTAVQLAVPHHLIATATATTTTSRAIAATVFTSIFSAVLGDKMSKYLPEYIAQAALRAGLPPSSLPSFVSALLSKSESALQAVPGVTPTVIGMAAEAIKQAYTDGIRYIYIIAAPFGALACAACFLLGDVSDRMTSVVEAPIEKSGRMEGKVAQRQDQVVTQV